VKDKPASLKRHWTRWTERDENTAKIMNKDGAYPRDIAAKLERTEAAIRYKLVQFWKDSQALNGGPLAKSVGAKKG
jgi:hypothetical protein